MTKNLMWWFIFCALIFHFYREKTSSKGTHHSSSCNLINALVYFWARISERKTSYEFSPSLSVSLSLTHTLTLFHPFTHRLCLHFISHHTHFLFCALSLSLILSLTLTHSLFFSSLTLYLSFSLTDYLIHTNITHKVPDLFSSLITRTFHLTLCSLSRLNPFSRTL